MIRDSEGRDISAWLTDGAAKAGIPVQLALACGLAESNLNPRAERFGRETAAAKVALANGDMATLRAIIGRAGNDLSFGVGQRICIYHYYGDRTNSLANVLAVRGYVFSHEAEDIREMCAFLKPRYMAAGSADLSPVGGDRLLMALCAYNAGHPPTPTEPYWRDRASTVARYREMLTQAAAMLAASQEDDMTIEEKAERLGPEKLGNGGQPETGVYEVLTNQGLVRMQVFWNGMLWEYTKPDGSTDVQVCVSAEADEAAQRAFRS